MKVLTSEYCGIIHSMFSLCNLSSGEIKMIMDPVQHKTQYTKHWPPDDVIPNGDTLTPDDDAVDNLLRCG